MNLRIFGDFRLPPITDFVRPKIWPPCTFLKFSFKLGYKSWKWTKRMHWTVSSVDLTPWWKSRMWTRTAKSHITRSAKLSHCWRRAPRGTPSPRRRCWRPWKVHLGTSSVVWKHWAFRNRMLPNDEGPSPGKMCKLWPISCQKMVIFDVFFVIPEIIQFLLYENFYNFQGIKK